MRCASKKSCMVPMRAFVLSKMPGYLPQSLLNENFLDHKPPPLNQSLHQRQMYRALVRNTENVALRSGRWTSRRFEIIITRPRCRITAIKTRTRLLVGSPCPTGIAATCIANWSLFSGVRWHATSLSCEIFIA